MDAQLRRGGPPSEKLATPDRALTTPDVTALQAKLPAKPSYGTPQADSRQATASGVGSGPHSVKGAGKAGPCWKT